MDPEKEAWIEERAQAIMEIVKERPEIAHAEFEGGPVYDRNALPDAILKAYARLQEQAEALAPKGKEI